MKDEKRQRAPRRSPPGTDTTQAATAATAPPPAAPSDEARGAPRSLAREYLESAVVTMIMALFFMTFVAQAASVPSASMQNTILVGDHFLINKFIFASGPRISLLPQRDVRRGDVIVFKYPGNREYPEQDVDPQVEQYKTFFIKRVIGLPGETIEVRGADVLINGRVLPEHRVTTPARSTRVDKAPLEISAAPPRDGGPADGDKSYTVYYDPNTIRSSSGKPSVAPPGFHFGVNGKPYVVPSDSYFVMGDNRDDSADSRVWGGVPRQLVVGRALFVIWSYDESAGSSGNFLTNFFKNTRWRRTGTLIK